MRHQKIVASSVLCLVFVATAHGQADDWQAVKDLPPGTQVSVTAQHRFIHTMCIFQGATDDELVCEVNLHRRNPFVPSSIRYSRANVRQIRLEHSDASNIMAGAAIGGGIGATLAVTAASSSRSREGGAILLGGLGSIVGGFLGRDFPIFHGKVIYRRAEPQRP